MSKIENLYNTCAAICKSREIIYFSYPITVKTDNAGRITSDADGGPSKNTVSGSSLNLSFLLPELSSSLVSSNISLSLKSPFAQALFRAPNNEV